MYQKIKSLQGLRIILFLIIFFFHANLYIGNDPIGAVIVNGGGGVLAVSVFFVLSGFVAAFKMNNISSFRSYIKYLKRKIMSFYPLHFFFLIVMAVIPYNFRALVDSLESKVSFILNGLLLQSWVPDASVWRGFNGPSWYLSTFVFLIAATPLLEYVDNKIKKSGKNSVVYLIIIVVMNVICFALPVFVRENAEYWLYAFPPVRLLDYASGYFAARLMVSINKQSPQKSIAVTVYETGCVLLFVTTWFVYPMIDAGLQRAAIFLPISTLFVYLIATERGIISRFLSKGCFVYFGDRSMFYYISHRAVLTYTGAICAFIGIDITKAGLNWLLVFSCLAITIGVGNVSAIILKKYRLRRQK